ncbi:MAG TPA: hypothetical protein GXZ89_07035 [Fastidiosipila sp.]|jgi:hypothetical protein|nr:hypothetical protein [Fastidiosipila sp.]
MILLSLSQEERTIPLAVFEDFSSGYEFVKQIPGFKSVTDTYDEYSFTYESIDPTKLPDYTEVSYHGNLVPITRFMFTDTEDIDILWQSIPNLDEPDQGLIEGATRVDAYIVGNEEVKSYIEAREKGFLLVEKILDRLGYVAGRDYAGSEDGEAITYRKNDEEDEHILAYMDPDFLQVLQHGEKDIEEWVKFNMGEEV